MEIRSLVGWNLRTLRVQKGISQDDLALNAGIERAYVGYLERGKKNPTIETLAKLADSLGCHVSDLLKEPPNDAEIPAPLIGGRRKRN
jgi:transcriptional regulator with XRE-family HTH domain